MPKVKIGGQNKTYFGDARCCALVFTKVIYSTQNLAAFTGTQGPRGTAGTYRSFCVLWPKAPPGPLHCHCPSTVCGSGQTPLPLAVSSSSWAFPTEFASTQACETCVYYGGLAGNVFPWRKSVSFKIKAKQQQKITVIFFFWWKVQSWTTNEFLT